MKKLLVIALLFLTTSITFAQTDAYSEDIKTMIKKNGVYDYYSNVVDQMFTMLKRQYASKNVPDDVWEDIMSVKKIEMNELNKMMVSAYRGYLNHKDVQKLNAMYNTKAGKMMVSDAQNLTEDQRRELSEFYGTETGQVLLSSQEEIDKLMSKISEMWSSSMYRNVVKRLADRGFTLEQ